MQLAPTLQMRAPRGWDLGQGPYLEEDSNRWGWEEPGLIIRSTKATSRVVHAQVGGAGCWTPPGLDRGGCSSLVARTKFFHGNSCLSQDGNLFDLGRTLAGDVPFSPGPVRESGGPDSLPIPATGAVQGGACGPPGGGTSWGRSQILAWTPRWRERLRCRDQQESNVDGKCETSVDTG